MAFRPNFMELNVCYPSTSTDGVFSPLGMGNFAPLSMKTPEFERLKHEVFEDLSPRDSAQFQQIPLVVEKHEEDPLSIEIPPDSPPFYGFSSGHIPNRERRKPLSLPLDSNVQEQLKVERKKERNRVAAAKCRKKKLDRIKYEEARIAHFKDELESLYITRNVLEKNVIDLKLQIWDHMRCGCNLNFTKEILQYMKLPVPSNTFSSTTV